MNIRWHGQSAYTLTGESHTVAGVLHMAAPLRS
jgi:hypothetical protein